MKITYLEQFELFSELDEKSKMVAAKYIDLHTERADTELFHAGEVDDIEYFLVHGEIELIASDGVKKNIVASDPAAHFPLALLRPRKFTAKVVSEQARLIKIRVDTLRHLRQSVPVAGDDFSAFNNSPSQALFSVETDEGAVKKFLVGTSVAIKENRLHIANFDDVSSTIFNVIQDSDVDIDSVVSAVQLDAAISAKLIKSANSALFGGMSKVDSVRSAVVRLGLDLTIQLISIMVLKEVFQSSKETLQEAMHKLWQSSLKLATYSVVVGRRSSVKAKQGQILLAGLMNEIGSLVIIAYLDQFPGSMKTITEQVLSSITFKKVLGIELLSHWQFPMSILNVLKNSDNYEREVEHPDVCDVVCIARLLIRMTSYRKLPFEDITETAVFKRLGFDQNCPNLIQDIQEEAHQYTELFTGAFEN